MRLADRRGVDIRVYEAAEDSWLLATTALEFVEPTDTVLDVGTGSGFVAEKIAAETGARVVGCDLNPFACRAARDAGIQVVRADLVDPFGRGVFDVVVFNPPYLPIPDDDPNWFELAVAGGESGRAVIDRFLAAVGRVVASDGMVVMLVSTLTGVDEVAECAAGHGFSEAYVAAEATYPGEVLAVLVLRP